MAAGEHVGIGHAWHGQMGIALSATIAGGPHAHQARILAVLHVADQDPVLDQHRATGRRALVVNRKRSAPLRKSAVVDYGDAF